MSSARYENKQKIESFIYLCISQRGNESKLTVFHENFFFVLIMKDRDNSVSEKDIQAHFLTDF